MKRAGAKRVPKPWGYEIWWAITDRYVGKILHVGKGHSLSYQYHNIKDETIYLYSGEMILEIEEVGKSKETIRLAPGDSIRITPLTKHRMVALDDCEIFEVSTPEVEDVVRLEDKYGRV
ncbi:MAG TPA: cupin domain-containing protein [Thermodesulfobacteriota bacterium]|nr:cupin domain-containing protein [Thermodesulfobacteriota bacterium]